ncbi:hypothetical protein [Legionella oakridgensis]|uniref:Dot/Icm secretion system substrate n=2 Tax=Legionella oakridgensis TaxID=29423 RepID=W0BBF0_9GAMM|nr:hypothetical protein [Legionella oakridgensis]AHE65947.1 hypothetical protein Loa_00358 [Legionella oakridgensis ATCC 33761 = DSM 21215]ETO94318.1 hypothetical protein LOR_8c00770 [Legionella oakridgensis RV-2-2007]KTD43797.1 substrate of the Dot/Icm secretion system [Legionella oakridgensis]STY15875.1 Dot/Icm secretion system substrate [Legionella longbeachae]
MPGLPLAKPRNGVGLNPLPSALSLQKFMEVATTAEAAKYGFDQFKERLQEAGVYNSSSKILEEMARFVYYREQQTKAAANPWSGEKLPTTIQQFQFNLATEAANQLSAKSITFDFAVSNASELLRGYSSNGQELDAATVDALDKLFNAWLVENNMMSKGGVIYEMDEKGSIKKDSAGNPVKADADKLRELISNSAHGFEAYVHNKNAEVAISSRQHAYPEQKVEEQVAAEAGPASHSGMAGG